MFPVAQPDPSISAEINRFVESLRNFLLPEIGLFKNFEVLFTTSDALGDVLGCYRRYTCDNPIFYLNVTACQQAAAESETPLDLVLSTTVLEMLAYPIQERFGLPCDNEEAEEFARQFRRGYVWRFWMPGRPVEGHIPF